MAEHLRPLAEVTKIIIDVSAVLSTRAAELLQKVIDELPDGEEPTPLTVDVSEDTTDTTHMTALLAWDNSGTGNHVTIDWDVPDAVDDDEPATGTATYQYTTPGTYAVTVTDLVDATRTATVDVTVPFVTGGPGNLTVTAVENTTDATRMTVDVTANNDGMGPVALEFGDASPVAGNPGDGTTVTTRLYTTAGTYTVTATDVDDATRVATTTVTVPFTATPTARRTRR